MFERMRSKKLSNAWQQKATVAYRMELVRRRMTTISNAFLFVQGVQNAFARVGGTGNFGFNGPSGSELDGSFIMLTSVNTMHNTITV